MRDLSTRHRKGRGALSNPDGRFESTQRAAIEDDWPEPEPERPATSLAPDRARSVLTENGSPDVPFELSLNPYRGCEHGCVYCFARPSHEYLGLSSGLDFETRLFYKADAARLLRAELGRRSYRCRPIALGVNTDAYQPSERKLGLTRELLQVMCEFRQPVSIITKSALVERDLDILGEMARECLAEVFFSITTLDPELARRMEPRATAPARRVQALAALAGAGVPTGVLFAPVIPALNEPEMETILRTAREAGAGSAGYVVLRLPHQVKRLFREWLAHHYPLRAAHVMSVLRAMHGGKDYDPAWDRRMRGSGPFAELIARRFERQCRALGLNRARGGLDCSRFAVPGKRHGQLDLL